VRRDKDLRSPETVRPRNVDGTASLEGTGTTDEMELRPREPRIRGNDTVLLEIEIKSLEPASGRTRIPEETERLEELRERAQRGNPFRLDAKWPAAHPRGGADTAGGADRGPRPPSALVRDPVLRDFDVKLTLLPLEKLDAEALKPFGYDLFAGVPSTFAPVTDVPVPAEYVVGPATGSKCS